jgi:hypothetical protein
VLLLLNSSISIVSFVSPFSTYVPIDNLPLFADDPSVGSIDLSKAKSLQEAEFGCRVNPRSVVATLRTVTDDHRNLQHILLDAFDVLIAPHPNYSDPESFVRAIEASYREWLELDHLLVGLWQVHSIRVKFKYEVLASIGGKVSRLCVESLLPQLTARGVVELVGRE